jgi:uncharacterized Zn finger protein (UPF0148 family)
MTTADFQCPHCQGQAFTDYGDGLVACQRCYVQFDLNQQLCPHCGTLLAEKVLVCVTCGADLRGGSATRTIRERLMTTRDWRRHRSAQFKQVRAGQDESSRQRLDAWWEEEQKRREAEHREQLARQQRERRFLIVAAVVVGLLLILIAVVSLLLLSSSGADPTPATRLHRLIASQVAVPPATC